MWVYRIFDRGKPKSRSTVLCLVLFFVYVFREKYKEKREEIKKAFGGGDSNI